MNTQFNHFKTEVKKTSANKAIYAETKNRNEVVV